MGKIITIANQKGGVGKTTTTVNLGASLAFAEARVLIVDIDPQSNASSGLGFTPEFVKSSIYECLVLGDDVRNVILKTDIHGLDIIPSRIDLTAAEIELVNEISRETRLKELLGKIKDDYDLILIDCPPSLGLLTVNAFTAADSVIIPLQCEYYAMEGLGQLLNTIKLIKGKLNSDLLLEGILLTMYDSRNNLSREVADQIHRFFPKEVFKAVIPRNVKISEAPSFGKPVLTYDIKSRGSASYLDLARELLERIR